MVERESVLIPDLPNSIFQHDETVILHTTVEHQLWQPPCSWYGECAGEWMFLIATGKLDNWQVDG